MAVHLPATGAAQQARALAHRHSSPWVMINNEDTDHGR